MELQCLPTGSGGIEGAEAFGDFVGAPVARGIGAHARVLDQHMLIDPFAQVAEKLTEHDPVGISRVPLHESGKALDKASMVLLMTLPVRIGASAHDLFLAREVRLVVGNQSRADFSQCRYVFLPLQAILQAHVEADDGFMILVEQTDADAHAFGPGDQ
jgi:hypothetical protein